MFAGLVALVAPHGIKQDLKNGDLRGLASQTIKTTQPTKKTTISHSERQINVLSDEQDIKQAISSLSAQYGLTSEFSETIKCESGFNPNPPGNLLSRGIAQFTLNTWLGNCSKTDERLNPYKSLDCMKDMWLKGEQYRWDCFCLNFGKLNKNCIKRGFK